MLLCVLLQQQQLNLVFFKCRVMCLRCVGVFIPSDVEECFQTLLNIASFLVEMTPRTDLAIQYK